MKIIKTKNDFMETCLELSKYLREENFNKVVKKCKRLGYNISCLCKYENIKKYPYLVGDTGGVVSLQDANPDINRELITIRDFLREEKKKQLMKKKVECYVFCGSDEIKRILKDSDEIKRILKDEYSYSYRDYFNTSDLEQIQDRYLKERHIECDLVIDEIQLLIEEMGRLNIEYFRIV